MTEALLARPRPCSHRTGPEAWCGARSFGPPWAPRCPDHGGPDPRVCEACDGPETPGMPMLECLESGWTHAECHAGRCQSRACAEFHDDADTLEDR